jgi:hypothetical protein
MGDEGIRLFILQTLTVPPFLLHLPLPPPSPHPIKVPELWLARSFPCLKPLGGFVREVEARCTFFTTWLRDGPPLVFWISGFFFTQVSNCDVGSGA